MTSNLDELPKATGYLKTLQVEDGQDGPQVLCRVEADAPDFGGQTQRFFGLPLTDVDAVVNAEFQLLCHAIIHDIRVRITYEEVAREKHAIVAVRLERE